MSTKKDKVQLQKVALVVLENAITHLHMKTGMIEIRICLIKKIWRTGLAFYEH